MKQISLAVAVAATTGFVGTSVALEAPGTDPIKDGQTVHSSAAAAPPTGDPIKDGQTFMAANGNDLGSPWPARPNYSVSPDWEAYAYDRGGVRFIQINDPAGVVRAVVGVSPGAIVVLPLGTDADHVIMGVSSGGEVVYRDTKVQIETIGGQWYVRQSAN